MNRSPRPLAVLTTAVLLAAASLVLAPDAHAQGASFQGLGDLPGGVTSSRARGVSDDGAAVVGDSRSGSGNEAFRWTAAGGMVGLGDLPSASFASFADAASADGSVVVGQASAGTGGAFRWTQAGGMVNLGDLNPNADAASAAHATSADGAVVVGGSSIEFGGSEAFRWTASGGMNGLGQLPGGVENSFAYGVSADGAVVVGQGQSGSGNEAFRWTAAGGMVGLGDLPGGPFESHAFGVSADGAVVVGMSASTSGAEAFRWTQGTGMVGLGDLPGGSFFSQASGASADGSVIVGRSSSASADGAFLWTAADGMRSLRDVLVERGVDMTGWTLAQAADISPDGRTIVGFGTNPQGQTEAFRAVLPGGHRWTDPTGGSWDVAANWSPASVPEPTDPVRFDLDATYTVTGGAGKAAAQTARALGADAGTVDFELAGLALTSPSTDLPSLTVSFDATAKIIAGTSTFVNGTVGFGSNAPGDTTTTARLQVFNPGTELTGSGALVVGGLDGGRGEVFVAAGALRTSGAVLGVGAVGESVVGNGGVWTVDNTLAVGFLQTGRLVVENGGGVTAGRLEVGRITDAGVPASRVDVAGFGAGERSRLFVADSLVVGGTGRAVFRIRDGADVTAGHLAVRGGDDAPTAEVVVGGAVTQGFDAELTATSLTVGQGGTLLAFLDVHDGGAVEVERFYVGTSGSTGFAFVTGQATLLARAAAFAGECEVAIGGSAGGVLSITGGGLVACDRAAVGTVGDGRVFVGNNGAAPVASSLVVSRVLKVGEGGEGVLSLAAGVVDAVDAPAAPPADPFDVIVFGGGQVEGTGTIFGSVDNAGTVAPGVLVVPPPSPFGADRPRAGRLGGRLPGGALLVRGRFTQEAGGTLEVALAGPDSARQGRLVIRPLDGAPSLDGSATLGGTLRLAFEDGYAPRTGDTFAPVDATSATGRFAATEVTGLEPGWRFSVSSAAGVVVVTSQSDGVPVAVEHLRDARSALALAAAPNPASGSVTFRYALGAPGPARLAVFDVLGREVAVVVDRSVTAGAHEASLDAGRLAPGVYVAQLSAGSEVRTRTVVLR